VPPPPEVAPGGLVAIRRFVLCKGVQDREPVEPTTTFPRERDGRVWVYLEAANDSGREQHVSVVFGSADRPGAAAPPVDLAVAPGPRYRTWAWATTWRLPGRYEVVVRDAAGTVLARAAFDVVE
jgi:hypothetical protein